MASLFFVFKYRNGAFDRQNGTFVEVVGALAPRFGTFTRPNGTSEGENGSLDQKTKLLPFRTFFKAFE